MAASKKGQLRAEASQPEPALPEIPPAPHVETELREAPAIDGPREVDEPVKIPSDGIEREFELGEGGRGYVPHCAFCTVERPCLAEFERAGYPRAQYARRFGEDSFAAALAFEADASKKAVSPPSPSRASRRKNTVRCRVIGRVQCEGRTYEDGTVADFPANHGLPDYLLPVED